MDAAFIFVQGVQYKLSCVMKYIKAEISREYVMVYFMVVYLNDITQISPQYDYIYICGVM